MATSPRADDGWDDLLLDGLPDVGLLDELQVRGCCRGSFGVLLTLLTMIGSATLPPGPRLDPLLSCYCSSTVA